MAGGSSVTPVRYDLAQFAQVSRVINSTSFVAGGLAGFDSGTFVGYSVWVLTKANKSSTAPKGELAKLISGFLGAGTQQPQYPGTITHDAFSAPLAVGDSVLLMHPAMASVTGMSSIEDGIYFNPVEGSPGTDWPVGTAGVPSNNLADARTIMQARNVRRLHLAGARVLTGTHTGANSPTVMTSANSDPFKPGSLVGLTIWNNVDGSSGVITANTTNTITVAALVGGAANIWATGDTYGVVDALGIPYRLTITANMSLDLVGNGFYDIVVDPGVTVRFTGGLVCQNLTTGAGAVVSVDGPVNIMATATCEGDIQIEGDCLICGDLDYNGVDGFGVQGSLRVSGILNNFNGGTVRSEVSGAHIGGDVSNSGAGLVSIIGDIEVDGYVTNTGGGDIEISGDLQAGLSIENTNVGLIVIWGDCQAGEHVTNSGGGAIIINGKLDINGEPGAVPAEGYVNNTGGGEVHISGDVYIAQDLINQVDNFRIDGNCYVGGMIDSSNGGHLMVAGNCHVAGTVVNDAAEIRIYGFLEADDIEHSTDGDILVYHDVKVGGWITNTGTGSIEIWGNCQIGQYIINSGGGGITIQGKLDINGDPDGGSGYLDNTDGGVVVIGNDAHVAGIWTDTSGGFAIAGNLWCGGLNLTTKITCTVDGNLYVARPHVVAPSIYIDGAGLGVHGDAFVSYDLTIDSGTMLVYGVMRCTGVITNSGTLEYMGTYPEQAVDITAVNAGELDYLNLDSTTMRYTIDGLVLKSADPGANTIDVRLYKLVNAVLTLVDTFQITTVNFGTYFTLMDMFGVPTLAGDTIQITVRASAGGPYAVTGSYTLRTDNGGTASGGAFPPA